MLEFKFVRNKKKYGLKNLRTYSIVGGFAMERPKRDNTL
jgi:hypothetical protein